VAQQARNLLMHLEDHADGAKFLIRDGDAKLTAVFGAAFTAIGVRIIKAPVRAPRANAIAERRVASAAASAWNRMLITGKRHLRLVLSEYADTTTPTGLIGRCSRTRPPDAHISGQDASIRVLRRDRLGGLIHEFAQVAYVTQFSGTYSIPRAESVGQRRDVRISLAFGGCQRAGRGKGCGGCEQCRPSSPHVVRKQVTVPTRF
jgi:hypothetical protein